MKNKKNFIPLDFPVMIGFEDSGKWFAIDIVKGKLMIGNNENDGISQISFLEFARMVSKNHFCYIYPNLGKNEQICSILCTKNDLLQLTKNCETNVYCIETDRTYQIKSGIIYSDGERISTVDMPDTSNYVIDPRLTIQLKKRKKRGIYIIKP